MKRTRQIMRIYFPLLTLFWVISCGLLHADQSFYRNSIGAPDGTVYLNLEMRKIAHLTIVIDGNEFAGTTDSITATFVGDFSSSDPISLGSFPSAGMAYSRSFPLQREIGTLKGVWLENTGYDSVLFAQFRCRIQSGNYELQTSRTWLETWDPSIVDGNNNDGFSPDSDIVLPSSSTLYFPVQSEYFEYTPQGINMNPS